MGKRQWGILIGGVLVLAVNALLRRNEWGHREWYFVFGPSHYFSPNEVVMRLLVIAVIAGTLLWWKWEGPRALSVLQRTVLAMGTCFMVCTALASPDTEGYTNWYLSSQWSGPPSEVVPSLIIIAALTFSITTALGCQLPRWVMVVVWSCFTLTVLSPFCPIDLREDGPFWNVGAFLTVGTCTYLIALGAGIYSSIRDARQRKRDNTPEVAP